MSKKAYLQAVKYSFDKRIILSGYDALAVDSSASPTLFFFFRLRRFLIPRSYASMDKSARRSLSSADLFFASSLGVKPASSDSAALAALYALPARKVTRISFGATHLLLSPFSSPWCLRTAF
jgi:hypothetical protein